MNENLKKIEKLYGEDLYRTLHDGVFTQLRNFERTELKTSLQSLLNEREELETKLNSNDLESVYPAKNNQTFDMDIEQDLKNDNEAIDKRLSEIDNEIDTLNARKEQLESDILSFSNALEILRKQQSFINQTRFPDVFRRNKLLINFYENQKDKKTTEVNSIPNKLTELEEEMNSITQQKQNNMDLSRTIRNSSNVQLDFEAMGKDADRLAQINKMIDSYNEKKDAYNNAIRNISNISFDPDAANKVSIINELVSTKSLEFERSQLQTKLDELSNKTNYDVFNSKDLEENNNSYKANYVVTPDYFYNEIRMAEQKIISLQNDNYVDMEARLAAFDEIADLENSITKWEQMLNYINAGINKGKKIYFSPLRDKDIEEMRQLQSQIANIDDKIDRLNQIKTITNDIVNNQNVVAQPQSDQQPVADSEPIISEQTTATANPSDLDNSDPTSEQDNEENEFKDDIATSMHTQPNENRFSRFKPHTSRNRSDGSEIHASFEDIMRAMPPEEHFEKQSGDDLDRSNFGFRRHFGPSTYSDPIPMPGKTDKQESFPSKPNDIPRLEDEDNLKPIDFGQFFDANNNVAPESDDNEFDDPSKYNSEEYERELDMPLGRRFSYDDYGEELSDNNIADIVNGTPTLEEDKSKNTNSSNTTPQRTTSVEFISDEERRPIVVSNESSEKISNIDKLFGFFEKWGNKLDPFVTRIENKIRR